MANYIKQLRPASFRGLSFLTASDEVAFGRRIVTHEYPGRDNPAHEDMGASVREFTIDAIIAGDSFISEAKSFEDALQKQGPAALVHPYYGSVNVIVLNFRRMHSDDAIGEVRFSITMQRHGEFIYPSALTNTVSGLADASDNLFNSITSDFADRFNIVGVRDFLAEDALARVTAITSDLSGLLSKAGLVSAIQSFIPSSFNVVENLVGQVTGIFQGLSSATKPVRKSSVGSTTSSGTSFSARKIIDVMATATSLTSGDASGRATRITNAAAIDYLYRSSALAAAASSARYASYESREDALAVRNNLAAKIEALRADLGELGYDDTWRSSGIVLAAVTKDINQRLGRLPKTVRIQPSAPRASIALAHRLYGDDPTILFDRAADVVRRNRVRHPGLVPVMPLEVLVNG